MLHTALNFFDDGRRAHLLPLAATRPLALMRWGMLTIAEKWRLALPTHQAGHLTAGYLQGKFPALPNATLLINGRVCPTAAVVQAVQQLAPGTALHLQSGLVVAYAAKPGEHPTLQHAQQAEWVDYLPAEAPLPPTLEHLYDLFLGLDHAIRHDFAVLTQHRTSATLSSTVQVLGSRQNIFLEPGAHAECCIINAKRRPRVHWRGGGGDGGAASSVGRLPLAPTARSRWAPKCMAQPPLAPIARWAAR